MKSGRGRRSYSTSPADSGGLVGWLTDWQTGNQHPQALAGLGWASSANPGTGQEDQQEGRRGDGEWSLDCLRGWRLAFVCDAPLPRAWTAFWDFWDYWERTDRGDPRSLVQGKGSGSGQWATG